ncbi:MAG: glycosyltransferase [Actinobacteria bacterium]|nr:glycosyltransferase [Actinomycetota bacterium]
MRILHINKRYPPHVGGIESHLQDLARAQAAVPGVEVEVAVVAEGDPGREVDRGVVVNRLPQLGIVASNPLSTALLDVLKASSHDVWHLHYPFPTGELAVLLASVRRPSLPRIVCAYHSDFVAQSVTKRVLSVPYSVLTKRFLDRADGVIVSSPQLAQSSSFLRRVAHKVRVIPFGIDPAPLQADEGLAERSIELRERYGTPLTLFVGRLVPYKGVDVLLEAFRHVPGTLAVVGEGPLRGRLEERAAVMGIGERVVFAGSLSFRDLVAHYHAADVFVLPSVTPNEAFGLVQLEAHACGVPVVSTDLPTGVPFANSHGETGLVVPPGDAVSLAAALGLLLEDEELRARLGAQARERQAKEFSLEAMTGRVLGYYEELLL